MKKSEIRKIRELMGDVYDTEKIKGVKKAVTKIINEGGGLSGADEPEERGGGKE